MPSHSIATEFLSAIDYPQLMDRLYDDRDLFKELVAIYVEELPGWIDEMRRSIDAGNAAGLRRIAHQVRGSAGNLSANQVATLAASLESMGRLGDLDHAEACFDRLQTALAELSVALHHFAEV